MPDEKEVREKEKKRELHEGVGKDASARRRKGYRVGALTLAGLFLAAALLALLPVHGEAGIYDAVLRLHVIADSDSAEDQALKLQVRDAVLVLLTPRLTGCTTRDEAEEVVRAAIPEIGKAAIETLAAAGCDDTVRVTLGQERYPTRVYETCCFPSGEYLSLRICIGEAAGANWWCVLFPPLCLSAAKVGQDKGGERSGTVILPPEEKKSGSRTVVWQIGNGERTDPAPGTEPKEKTAEDPEEAFIAVGLTPEQYRIITETDKTKYKMRFRILEIFEETFRKNK